MKKMYFIRGTCVDIREPEDLEVFETRLEALDALDGLKFFYGKYWNLWIAVEVFPQEAEVDPWDKPMKIVYPEREQ